GHWEKRNGRAMEAHTRPTNLDKQGLKDLFTRFGGRAYEEKMDELMSCLSLVPPFTSAEHRTERAYRRDPEDVAAGHVSTARAPIDAVRKWIDEAQCLVALTGAGISTDAGIPDFRGPQGVWTKNPEAEKQSTLQNYVADAEVRKRAWQSRLTSPAWQAQPNDGHRAFVTLEKRGKLDTLITQNIDGLHVKAGSSRDRVVESHGTMNTEVCLCARACAAMECAL